MRPLARLRLRLLVALLAALLTGAGPLAAQDSLLSVRRGSPFLVKYGKWVTLAAAIGMGLQAQSAHEEADRSYRRLEQYCLDDDTRCDLGANGKYLDPVTEGYYRAANRSDRRARHWLVGGEVSLLATAGMFVWELARPRQRPDNIPFEPEMRWDGRRARVGVSVAF